jgi:hypothetical protein
VAIEKPCFASWLIKSITVPRSIERRRRSCFSKASTEAKIVKSESNLVRIEELAFEGSPIQSMHLPKQAENINRIAFADCLIADTNMIVTSFSTGTLSLMS